MVSLFLSDIRVLSRWHKIESQVSVGVQGKQETVLQGKVSTYICNMDLHGSTFSPVTVLIATVLCLLETKMPSSTSRLLQGYVSTENGSNRGFMFSLIAFICKGKVTWSWMSQAGGAHVLPHLCCRSRSPENCHLFSTSRKAACEESNQLTPNSPVWTKLLSVCRTKSMCVTSEKPQS